MTDLHEDGENRPRLKFVDGLVWPTSEAEATGRLGQFLAFILRAWRKKGRRWFRTSRDPYRYSLTELVREWWKRQRNPFTGFRFRWIPFSYGWSGVRGQARTQVPSGPSYGQLMFWDWRERTKQKLRHVWSTAGERVKAISSAFAEWRQSRKEKRIQQKLARENAKAPSASPAPSAETPPVPRRKFERENAVRSFVRRHPVFCGVVIALFLVITSAIMLSLVLLTRAVSGEPGREYSIPWTTVGIVASSIAVIVFLRFVPGRYQSSSARETPVPLRTQARPAASAVISIPPFVALAVTSVVIFLMYFGVERFIVRKDSIPSTPAGAGAPATTPQTGTGVIAASSRGLPSERSGPEKEKVFEVFSDPRHHILREIAACESGFRQWNDDSSVLQNEAGAVGVMQILESVHRARAKSLGYDIDTFEGNTGYALILFEENGVADWAASIRCWGKSQPQLGVPRVALRPFELDTVIAVVNTAITGPIAIPPGMTMRWSRLDQGQGLTVYGRSGDSVVYAPGDSVKRNYPGAMYHARFRAHGTHSPDTTYVRIQRWWTDG
jgi:hypothetical protein